MKTMKKLQSNFTTPEQSKRLLELGVPEWTADLKHPCIPTSKGDLVLSTDIVVGCQEIYEDEIPLWSAGRLIEICILCTQHYTGDDVIQFQRKCLDYGLVECLIALLSISKKDGDCDFSKLEE